MSDYRQPPRPAVEKQNVAATVKWFNADKGFGFLTVPGNPDVFIHASVLNEAGVAALAEGDSVTVDTGRGPKGPQAVSLKNFTAAASGRSSPSSRPAHPAPAGRSAEGSVEGTVKWYNEGKGFGFVSPSGGGKDIFVHASVLQRAGVRTLAEGSRVSVVARLGQKGMEAESIQV